ncbi:Replication protein 15 [Burkholderia pseudomallei]|nr:Replication protein 15 [Burkholderia pseudomallei]CAJ5536285.1 Replication protein 15 [Burkholderia pseudomallei]CAJ7425854.1 Replication protein 15 [Burkholderia pseudomallei]CAJ7819758.1 Replication protein 15 [Burkholderia pseudomallei]
MGRIRTVKPELFTHEGLFEAEQETGLPLRVAFIGLFTCADREGRFKWRPRTLKLAVLPHDEVDFSRVLDALLTRGFLVKYSPETGEEIGLIPTFTKHQVINNRETPSDLPDPPADLDLTGVPTRTPTRDSRVPDASPTRAKGKGKEGKGKTRDERVTRFDAQAHLESFGVPSDIAKDWLAVRKAKRLAPTATAFDDTKAEADKAGISMAEALRTCVIRGWGGFKAEWLADSSPRANGRSTDNPFA